MTRASSRGWHPLAPFLLAVVLALALRLENARTGGLWLDDFHSLHHARAASWAEFLDVLARDNHPPLSFVLVKGARAALGEGEWALRIPALLAGLATLLLVWRTAGRLGTRGRAAATLLLAVSGLHVDLSTDVRMYALLALACAGLLDALLDLLEDGRGAWRVTLWSVVGLYTHYHFVYSLAALGGTALGLAALCAERKPRLPRLSGAFALALALALPWYALVFPEQLGHGLPPGGSFASPARLLEGYKNLVFPNVSVGGPALRAAGIGASAALLALIALGAVALARTAPARLRAPFPALVLASALGVPLLTAAGALLSERAGFEWRYLAGALPAVCLAFGAAVSSAGPLLRARRAAAGVVLACALLVTWRNARDPGAEDYRGAVDWITEHARPGDAVVAADWQPPLFPPGLAWEYYSARVPPGRHVPERLATKRDAYWIAEPGRLAEHPRVFCCLRSIPNTSGILRTLRERYSREDTRAFGRSVHAHLFEHAPEDGR